MAQNYFYNGTQLDTFDGTKGVIVSHVSHDSSAEAVASEMEVVRAGGKSLRDFRYSGKQITVDGTIVGETQADFEQRLDALKNLFASPSGRLTITNYGTLDYRIATFEYGEAWTRQVTTTAGNMWNYATSKIGTRGLIVKASTGSGARTASWVVYKDLGDFATTDTIKLWAYIDDASKLTSIRLRFETIAGSVYYTTTWNSGFVNGWNELTALKSAFTTNGSPAWGNINNIELEVTGSSATAVNVTFDDLRVSTTTDTRNYDVTQTGALRLERQQHNAYWVDFSVSLTCSSGIATATNAIASSQMGTADIQHEPLYLPGSGPQYLTYRAGVGSAAAEKVTFYDHWADHFGGYGAFWQAVADFEATETWDAGSADTTHVKVGSQGLKVTATDPTPVTTTRTITSVDYSTIPDSWETQIAFYVDDSTKLTEVIVLYDSTAASAGYSKSVTGLVTGWNIVTIAKSAFTQYGGGDWAAIVSLSLTVNPTGGAVNVTADNWQWIDPQNTTGGVYTSNADAWAIAAYGAYPHALINLSTTNDTTMALTNTTIRDGEIVALVNGPSTATVGVCARLETTNALLNANYSAGENFVTGSYTSGATTAFSLNGGNEDGGTGRLVTGQVTYSVALDTTNTWRWLRLVCKSNTAWLYSREMTADDWTLRVTAPVRANAAGYWGLHAGSGVRFAQVEIIDYAAQQSSALTLKGGPFGTDSYEGIFQMESRGLQLTEGPHQGLTSGSFPHLRGAFNRCAMLVPGAVIGTRRFYYLHEDMSTTVGFGDATTTKLAVPVASGSQTYLRQRGSFVYLGKGTAGTTALNATVRIETDTAGSPSGTLVHANATCTLANADIQTYYDDSGDFNNSFVPYELLFPADIAIAAATTYWVVFTLSGTDATQLWSIPAQVDTGAQNIKAYNGSWATVAGPLTGYVLLAGNTPGLASRARYSLHRPTFL